MQTEDSRWRKCDQAGPCHLQRPEHHARKSEIKQSLTILPTSVKIWYNEPIVSTKGEDMSNPSNTRKQTLLGFLYGGLSFTIWGLLPLYWQLVQALTPYQVFAHRVVWSFFFLLPILAFRKELKTFYELLINPKVWIKLVPAAIFISINWLVYIWSVTQGYVIEASLGYYINPLVLTCFGIIFFKERLTKMQALGIGSAAIGVIIKTLSYGQVPWIALILAFSFA